MRNFRSGLILAAAAFFAFAGTAANAQNYEYRSGSREFCSNNNYSSGERKGFSEVREFSLPASGKLSVDGGKNGGIAVKGGDVGGIQVRACVNTWGTTEAAARAAAEGIRISTGDVIRAEGTPSDSGWGVSFMITLPRNTDLNLVAKNGGIAISNVSGDLEFETVNGGVALSDVSGDVRGRTTNGGISVVLGGSSWIGNGLDVETTNGGISLKLPQNFAANIEGRTVNGGFKSDIPELNVTTEDVKGEWGRGSRAKSVNTSINGGGAPIKVRTTNGGVKISTIDEAR
ncbi:MAG: hypothetical protein QUS14_03775 [Pyrinomonadaceae bacterium]|nr:hypothetical protein [Pyrinomonadaceae bacterium]